MAYVGIFLYIWLFVGFLIGLKAVYIDKVLTPSRRNAQPVDEDDTLLKLAMKSRWTFLSFCSLLGLILLYPILLAEWEVFQFRIREWKRRRGIYTVPRKRPTK